MPRMIDSIKASGVSANLMQSAARGALAVPPQEMLEILVYLATQTKIFAERARLTLAGWDETSARAAAADPRTPKEVLTYLITPGNLRPTLLPLLLENPSVSEQALAELAATASRLVVESIVNSARVNQSHAILTALSSNPHLNPAQTAAVKEKLSTCADPANLEPATEAEQVSSPAEAPAAATQEPADGDVADEALAAYLTEHAAEIATENKPFQPIGGVHEELPTEVAATPVEVVSEPSHADPSHGTGAAAAPKRAPQKKVFLSASEERGTALQKIAKLDTQGRIQLAMKGNKEERSLLIRDGTKIVALAVLESPKLTDGEAEKFATQKNVLEAVLRAISMKRKFMKQYAIIRNLTSNPRTPIDVALGLVKHLLTQDLRHLAGNKEVSETVRKMAMRMFRQKLEVTSKN
jgi:hypothetical protein